MNNRKLLFVNGLNQEMAAEQIGVRKQYVSMYITGRGQLPRAAWQKIHEFFINLKVVV